MTPLLVALTWATAAVLAMMFAVWLLSLKLRNAGIIDIFWGLGFVLATSIYFVQGGGEAPRRLLVLVLVAVWGCRLAGHIFWRGRGEGEDYRYASMRRSAGDAFWWRSLFTIFCLQGVLVVVVALPLLWVQMAPQPTAWQWSDGLALVLWCVGFFFEAVGDWQLARFKADPDNKGKVMDRGLWSMTRHPNYFGDFVVWWSYFCFTLAVPGGWWTVFGTILMSVLLMRVSGVALLEKTITERRPGYRDYIERTPAFFPQWPSRREGSS